MIWYQSNFDTHYLCHDLFWILRENLHWYLFMGAFMFKRYNWLCLIFFVRVFAGPDDISPRASPASTTRSSASTPSKYQLGPSPLVAPTSSPPVVTIAPTHTTSTSLDARRVSKPPPPPPQHLKGAFVPFAGLNFEAVWICNHLKENDYQKLLCNWKGY